MTTDDTTIEAHRSHAESEYFDSRPAIDCNDRRTVFQEGFDRGWKAARDDVERFLKPGESIEECLQRNRRDIDTLMGLLAEEKKRVEILECAPSPDAARAMGESGGPVVEGERLAFEAWMAGHNWMVVGTWDGTQYVSDMEKRPGRYVDHGAMATRQLWAAWRDRAALARK